jgi:hypothetical protein
MRADKAIQGAVFEQSRPEVTNRSQKLSKYPSQSFGWGHQDCVKDAGPEHL